MRTTGFTLIELFIVVSIIALLAALLTAAVQFSREAARRTQCVNNLRQIGLAIAQYEAQHKAFPPGSASAFSWHVAILPHLEQESLFNRLHDERRRRPSGRIFVKEVPAVFVCPSDPAPIVIGADGGATTNYAGNNGIWAISHGYNGVFRHLGPVTSFAVRYGWGPIRAGDVHKGLSNTAAVAEILHADGAYHRLRVNWYTPRAYSAPTELDAFTSLCESLPPEPQRLGWRGDPWSRGYPWTIGNEGFTLYNHASPPNRPSCLNQNHFLSGIFTAASQHRAGVNLLFADGHVTFNADTVDRKVWRQLASRNAR